MYTPSTMSQSSSNNPLPNHPIYASYGSQQQWNAGSNGHETQASPMLWSGGTYNNGSITSTDAYNRTPTNMQNNHFKNYQRSDCLFENGSWQHKISPSFYYNGVNAPNGYGPTKKPKRVRTAFTTAQVMELEDEYERSKYLDRNRRIHLSNSMKLSEKTIKVWFQNRRMKEKKDMADESGCGQFVPLIFNQNNVPVYMSNQSVTLPTFDMCNISLSENAHNVRNCMYSNVAETHFNIMPSFQNISLTEAYDDLTAVLKDRNENLEEIVKLTESNKESSPTDDTNTNGSSNSGGILDLSTYSLIDLFNEL